MRLTLLFLTLFFSGCWSTTQTAQEIKDEVILLRDEQQSEMAWNNEGIEVSLGYLQDPPQEVEVALKYNEINRAIIGDVLTDIQKGQVLDEVLSLLEEEKKAVIDLKLRLREAESRAKELEKLEPKLIEIEEKVYENSENWERYQEDKFWSKVKRIFTWIGTLGIGSIILYVLLISGGLPLVIGLFGKLISLIAGAFPRVAYRLGLVTKDAFDEVTHAVSDIRKEKKKEKSEAPTEQERRRAAQELDKIDGKLKTYIKPTSKNGKLVEYVREKNHLT